MSRYIVAGAAGFIGSRVAELLATAGHSVVGIDNLNDAYDVRLKEWRLRQLCRSPNFRYCQLDICDRGALENLFNAHQSIGEAQFDGMLNLAARAGVRQSVVDPWVYLDTNVTGCLNLLEICRAFGIEKFVLASTSSLYGSNRSQPFSENLTTDAPLSPYAASKKAAEAMCYTYHHLYGLDVSVLRYFTVYGPAGRPDMSPFRFVQWIYEERPVTVYGDGTQQRDFTYVDDIARGTIASLKPVGYQVINLGSDKPVGLNDVIALIERLVGSKADIKREPMHQADVRFTWAEIKKAKQLLEWKPQVGIEEGFERLVDWYRQNRDWAKDIETGP